MLHLPFLNNAVVVHGGLDPNIPTLQDQIPYMVMNMRDIDSNNQTQVDSGTGNQWAQVWNTDQELLTVDNTNIYYGHDSSRGLNIRDYSYGLDTGCVYGGQLTAIDVRTHELTQINCITYVKKGGNSDD
jgi:diadenosine tetraphosphatase ApaH/serine/threonine PP2A family protein phosphatase